MTPERWRQVTQVFHAALAREGAARGALLDDACAGDLALRAEVDGMLAAHENAGRFGDDPAFAPDEEIPRLQPGDALGPYRIEMLIESGGMGEVYRARDTRLDRDVAVKVLRVHAASDPALKQRLEREAKALATLSHPHICPVFDVGQQDGIDYLVMEYLDGETLEKRLTKGALPLDQALRCAIEVADALDKAHRRGIVHRDLKPSNIMLTKKGAQLLDFGLAKLRAPSPLAAIAAGGVAPSPLTGQGTIVGTLQYMAPEQLNGEEADARTDIFAFGAVVYEMVTGKKAFEGKTPASIIAAILEREPTAISTLQPMSPPALDHLVRTCMAKAPEQRWQSAGDLGRSLAWLLGEGSQPGAAAAAAERQKHRRLRRALPFAVAAGVGGLIVGVAAWVLKLAPLADPRPISRFDYELPEGLEFRNADRAVMALSADGSQFVYNTTRGLYRRSLRESDARLIPGTEEDLSGPFFSPDGQWVGYFSGGHLKKIATSGGTPIPLCEAEAPFGAHWGSDGMIVYGQSNGIQRVSAKGGTPELLVPARAGEQVYGPEVLPGGKWVLFTAARADTPDHRDRPYSVVLGRWDQAAIVAQSLDSGERKLLWTGGSDGRYVPTGHLVFAVADGLFALALDLDRLAVSGAPVRLVTGVQRPVRRRGTVETGFASYGFSDRGTLVYVQDEVTGRRVPALVDREGRVQRLNLPPAPYVNPRLSPDGRRVVVQTLEGDGRGDVWVYDLSGKSQIRQLTVGGNNWYPLWTPDSRRVTFASDREGARSIYWQLADGSAVAQRLTIASEGADQRPDSWSPDGTTLAFRVYPKPGPASIWTLTPGSGNEPRLFYDIPGSDQYEAAFSPDGRWLAYTSTETGSDEIYVLPFPRTGPPVRLTQEGGAFPMWSPDGREIFFRRSFHRQVSRTEGARLFSVPITTRGTVELGVERTLPMEGFLVFNTYRDYDITRDGKRFLMVFPVDRPARPPRISVVQNWFEELKARIPVS